MKCILIGFLFFFGYMSALSVHELRDSVKIYFHQGKIDLDPSLSGNKSALDRIADSLRTNYSDSVYRLRKVLVVGITSKGDSLTRIIRFHSGTL